MAIALAYAGAHVFGQESTVQSTATTAALSQALTTSNLVVGFAAWPDAGASSWTITDNAGTSNTYNLLTNSVASNNLRLQPFWGVPTHAGGTTFTITLIGGTNTANYMSIFAAVYTGQAASPLDQHPAPALSVTNTATPTATQITPSQNGCLIFSCCLEDAGVTVTAAGPSPITAVLDQDTLILGADAYGIQTTAAPITCTFTTGSTTGIWVAWAGSFLPAAASIDAFSAPIFRLQYPPWR